MRNKVLTIIGVVIGVLVLLLVQTEGFEDSNWGEADVERRNNSPEYKAFIASQNKAYDAIRPLVEEEQAAKLKGDNKKAQMLKREAHDQYNKTLSDLKRKNEFNPRMVSMDYWMQNYNNGNRPQPAVKSMPAVAPSQPIVKKAQPVRPSQPAPSVKVQNTAIPSKKTK